MIKVGDKIRFLYGGSTEFNRGDILTVKSVIPYSDGTYSICFTEEANPGDWVYPDPEFFEFVEKEIGVKYDSEKIRFDLIPPECEAMIAAVLTMGCLKYSANNWQKIEDIQTRYFNAESRHMNAKRLGELFDPESGLPHSAHAIVSLIFILWEDIKDNIGVENVLSFITDKLKNYKDMLDKK